VRDPLPSPTSPPRTGCRDRKKNGGHCPSEGLYLDLNFLYWQPKVDGLEYAQREEIHSNGNPFVVDTQIDDLDFSWAPGAKVTVGYVFPSRDQWVLDLSWTYLHPKGRGSDSTNDPSLSSQLLRPFLVPVLLGSVADRATANWQMNYNLVDIDLGRDFSVGRWITVSPHAGLRGAWLYQTFTVRYHGGYQFLNAGTFSTLFKNTSFDAKNHFCAIGMRGGADLEWRLSSRWSIVANLAGSLLYGKFNIAQKLDGGFLLSTGTVFINDEIANTRDSLWRLRPCFETEMGMKWQIPFNKGKYCVFAAATYNFVYWPGQNELINSITTRDSTPIGLNQINFNADVTPLRAEGDLQLQGVKLAAGFDF